MKNTGIAIVSLVGGMIIGSALTMLFTPQSGPELRQKIKDSIDDEIDKVKDKLGKVEGDRGSPLQMRRKMTLPARRNNGE